MGTRIHRRLVTAAAIAALVTSAAANAGQRKPEPAPSTSFLTPSVSGRDNFLRYCAPCHGRDARGNGPVAAALRTMPADLTKISMRNNGVYPADRVRRFITNGAEVLAHGPSDMPVWGPTFRSLETSDKLVEIRIANLVAYLESIQQ